MEEVDFFPEGNTHSGSLWNEWHDVDISLLCGLVDIAEDSPDFFQNLSYYVYSQFLEFS